MRKSDERFVASYDFEVSGPYPDVSSSLFSTLFTREPRMEQSVREAFPDGVYSILLRGDCSEQEVVRQVADIVKKSGGEYEGMLIEANKKVLAAVGRAVEWFHDRACLFQIRDLGGSCHADLIRKVNLLADCGKSSFMLTHEENDEAFSSVLVVEEYHPNTRIPEDLLRRSKWRNNVISINGNTSVISGYSRVSRSVVQSARTVNGYSCEWLFEPLELKKDL